MKDRHAARAIVLHEDKLLFMERWHQGSHYFSIPGGSIELGETPEKAVEREVLEETRCQVKALREIYKVKLPDGSLHRIYLCEYLSGEPALPPESPEARKSIKDNRFKPQWVEIADLPDIPMYVWQNVRMQLLHDLRLGFPEAPLELA